MKIYCLDNTLQPWLTYLKVMLNNMPYFFNIFVQLNCILPHFKVIFPLHQGKNKCDLTFYCLIIHLPFFDFYRNQRHKKCSTWLEKFVFICFVLKVINTVIVDCHNVQCTTYIEMWCFSAVLKNDSYVTHSISWLFKVG